MEARLLHGNFLHSKDDHTIEILENRYLLILNGLIVQFFHQLPAEYAALSVTDFGDRLIIPGMIDLHLHAPQFSFRGLGMDMELLDWLNAYSFPEEAKYSDLEYAEHAYQLFADHLKRSFTTRASIFATVHRPATDLLMQKMEDSGLITYVGKVNMDRNAPDYLRENTAEQSLADTEQWICETKDRFPHTKPILTPRFIPSCTDPLLHGLKKLQVQYDLSVQSHLSENYSEINLVRQLCPDSKFYGDAYDMFGLFGGDHPCIMAHCVHSNEAELERIKSNGVYIAHSPESNMNLASGVAPVAKYLAMGLHVGLATDIAGGSHESMFRAVTHAIQASKLRWRLQDASVPPLTFEQAFYLATAGGGSFFGPVGRFEKGFAFDAIVLDDTNLDHPQTLSLRDRLERAIYLADERNIYAKYVAGNRII